MNEVFIQHKIVIDWSIKAFEAMGVPLQDASLIANSLTETSLFGIDSHGIARVTHYLKRFQNGTINKTANLQFERTAASTGRLNGDDGHGILIMTHASDRAIDLAREAGTGVVGVFNSSHCGAIGLYTRRITKAGMIGFAFTHSDSLVVPYGGKDPFLGTNPISIAFPTLDEEAPVCLDMATSIVPWNFIMNAKREKKKIPIGLGIDSQGNDSVDAEQIVAVKPMADHKGYALAFLIELLCGPLNSMNFGPNLPSMYKDLEKKRKLGSLVVAIDPDRFGGINYVRSVVSRMIEQAKGYGENIKFPGEPEYAKKKERLNTGLPFSSSMIADFNIWAENLHINPIY